MSIFRGKGSQVLPSCPGSEYSHPGVIPALERARDRRLASSQENVAKGDVTSLPCLYDMKLQSPSANTPFFFLSPALVKSASTRRGPRGMKSREAAYQQPVRKPDPQSDPERAESRQQPRVWKQIPPWLSTR